MVPTWDLSNVETIPKTTFQLTQEKEGRQAGKTEGRKEKAVVTLRPHCFSHVSPNPPAFTLNSFSASQSFLFNSGQTHTSTVCFSLRGLAKSCCDINESSLFQDSHRHFSYRSAGAHLHTRHCLFPYSMRFIAYLRPLYQ